MDDKKPSKFKRVLNWANDHYEALMVGVAGIAGIILTASMKDKKYNDLIDGSTFNLIHEERKDGTYGTTMVSKELGKTWYGNKNDNVLITPIMDIDYNGKTYQGFATLDATGKAFIKQK